MNAQPAPVAAARRRRRFALAAGALAALALLAAVSLRIALRPEHVTRLVMERAGAALGLQITARGVGDYTLRGTPRLVLRDVDAREPGARTPLLRAARVAISVPWSTLRSRGAVLDVRRVELEAPVLDLAALQAWRATRPPSDTPLPTLSGGLSITRGRVHGAGWRIEGLHVELPRFAPAAPLTAHARGRYADAATTLAFDLALAMSRPAGDAGSAASGTVTLSQRGWSLPARIRASGPLHVGDGGTLRIVPLRLSGSARYLAGDTDLPFALGVRAPLRFDGATWSLGPGGFALRSASLLPEFDARGTLAYGKRLALRLEGTVPRWNDAWPALPPPLGQSASPLPFSLAYAGPADASGVATLSLRRDAARFDGRFRLPDVLAWAGADGGTPLPPLDGRMRAPRMDISGATLQGVEIEFDAPGVPDAHGVPAPARSR